MPDPGKLFDPVRRKAVAARPEEAVRQALVRWLIDSRRVPPRLIAVEFTLPGTRVLRRRADVVVWRPGGSGLSPWLLAECKAPAIALGARAADQVRRYAERVRAEWVLLTNGKETRYFQVREDRYVEAAHLPEFELKIKS